MGQIVRPSRSRSAGSGVLKADRDHTGSKWRRQKSRLPRVYHFWVTMQRLHSFAGLVPVLLVDAGLSFALWLLGTGQLVSDRHPFDDRRHGPGGGPGGGGPGPGGPAGFHNPDTLTYGLLGL